MWQLLLGSLTGPECRRALDRRWVLVVRFLSTLPAAMLVLACVWFWWLSSQFERNFSPGPMIEVVLILLEGCLITAALVLSPAMLAGSLSGERVRGVLAMLLASEVSPREIIQGRLTGRLAVVTALVAANLPGIVLLGALNGWGVHHLAVAVLLPLAVAIGGGGMAMAASSFSRRGRDALLAVFLAELVALLAPVFGGMWFSASTNPWIIYSNPFAAIGALVDSQHDAGPALRTIAIWSVLGIAGTGWAIWRLRPNYMRDAEGAPVRGAARRRARVPEVGDRPVLWKELHIEQLRSTQRIARWLGIFVVAAVLLTSTGLTAACVYANFVGNQPLAGWSTAQLATWIGATAMPLGWLLQWALGLRAAVCIASERERATWDALLASPLDGREIVTAKIYGNLFALRAYLAAVLIAWTLAALSGAIPVGEYATLLGNLISVGVFMVTVGVWTSLANSSATVAMTLTLVGWLIGLAGLAVATVFVVLMLMLVGTILYALGTYSQPGLIQRLPTMSFGMWFSWGFAIVRPLLYLAGAGLIATYCWRNFDRLAGRAGQLSYVVSAQLVRRDPLVP